MTALPLLAAASLGVFIFPAARAQTPPTLTTLYAFQAKDDSPTGRVLGAGSALYGTTLATVFTLDPPASAGGAWTETALQNVELPTGIAFGPKGEIYGMTIEGGGAPACPNGCGTVFALTPPASPGRPWAKHVLYTFTGDGDGAFPTGAPVIGRDGTLYGTTQYGGAVAGCSGIVPGCGTVFALTPPASPGGPWTETLPYIFRGGGDGYNPGGGLVIDENGNLYGTTPFGGEYLKGAVFELIPPVSAGGAWTKAVIYSFTGKDGDGYQPSSGLVAGKDGGLYGATALGGIADGGMVFALYPPASAGAWTERVLYRFEVQGGLLPVPNGDLAIGKGGAIFGTTAHGGIFAPLCSDGCGLVFGLYPPSAGGAWTAKVLYTFGGGSDGAGPLGGLAIGPEGGLYGATAYGGDLSCKPPIGCGTAFQLVP